MTPDLLEGPKKEHIIKRKSNMESSKEKSRVDGGYRCLGTRMDIFCITLMKNNMFNLCLLNSNVK